MAYSILKLSDVSTFDILSSQITNKMVTLDNIFVGYINCNTGEIATSLSGLSTPTTEILDNGTFINNVELVPDNYVYKIKITMDYLISLTDLYGKIKLNNAPEDKPQYITVKYSSGRNPGEIIDPKPVSYSLKFTFNEDVSIKQTSRYWVSLPADVSNTIGYKYVIKGNYGWGLGNDNLHDNPSEIKAVAGWYNLVDLTTDLYNTLKPKYSTKYSLGKLFEVYNTDLTNIHLTIMEAFILV